MSRRPARRVGRRTARELALKVLFQVDVGKQDPAQALRWALEGSGLPPDLADYATRLVEGTLKHVRSIDGTIRRQAREWRLERLANVDRNVLRLAVYELRHEPDVPASVVIDEAVELAKKYSTAESGRFVNGILGRLVRDEPPAGER